MTKEAKEAKETKEAKEAKEALPYVQNRELSWLAFNERCLDQGADKTVPLLERMKFVSIFWSNLQEFFMVRVGSLTDLSLLKKTVVDAKSRMTPAEQIEAIHARCHELYPLYERTFVSIEEKLDAKGIHRVEPAQLTDEQRDYVKMYAKANIIPYLAPQVVNVHHPFPHLENGALYVVTSLSSDYVLDELNVQANATSDVAKDAKGTKDAKASKDVKKGAQGARGAMLGIIPVPSRCERVIILPGKDFSYMLVEHAVEMIAPDVFSMYTAKRTNIICITRNADLDATEGVDEEVDFREHMKKILKKRGRLAAVRLDSQHKLSSTMQSFLLERLNLTANQCYTSAVPLDMGYAFALPSLVGDELAASLVYEPFEPAWPATVDRKRSLIGQIDERDILLTYPYESMDVFLELIREAVFDPDVVSIKITLYRLAKKSRLADLLISAAEAGKDVTLLFELRARFDEGNNIEWSQRCEDAGCKVVYGFRDYKVHSKLCLITRKTPEGMKYTTQVGTGNYNEKTAALYTDVTFMTSDERIGRDAVEFFQNVGLEAIADTYEHLCVAPVQIKRLIMDKVDEQIALAQAGEPCGLFFKTNSVTDAEIIGKLAQASQAGVPVTMLVRGISCLVPGVEGFTDNVRVVSIVGRLLEHSRIYGFGPLDADSCELYISSADLMTRNMDRRVEIACPVYDSALKAEIVFQMKLCLSDTVKLRELKPDRTYTPLGFFVHRDEQGKKVRIDAQSELIARAAKASEAAAAAKVAEAQKGETADLGAGRMKAEGLGGSEVAIAAVVAAEVQAVDGGEAAAAGGGEAVGGVDGVAAAGGEAAEMSVAKTAAEASVEAVGVSAEAPAAASADAPAAASVEASAATGGGGWRARLRRFFGFK